MTTTYTFYDVMARRYGITTRKVGMIVKSSDLPKRKIYGCLAVGTREFEKEMEKQP